MKIAICGPGQCGKDAASQWLADNTTLCYHDSTSEAAAGVCFDALRYKYAYADAKEAFDDRRNHREEWAGIIWDYNRPDGLTLYRGMLETNDILNGIRRAGELQALLDAGMLDLTLWIARDVPRDPSCELVASDCDITVPNDGTLDALFTRLSRFAAVTHMLR